jgi:hypothetical protein
MAGGEYLGFNNSIFLSERDTADRNQGRNSPIVASSRFLTGQATNLETILLLCGLNLSNETVA